MSLQRSHSVLVDIHATFEPVSVSHLWTQNVPFNLQLIKSSCVPSAAGTSLNIHDLADRHAHLQPTVRPSVRLSVPPSVGVSARPTEETLQLLAASAGGAVAPGSGPQSQHPLRVSDVTFLRSLCLQWEEATAKINRSSSHVHMFAAAAPPGFKGPVPPKINNTEEVD